MRNPDLLITHAKVITMDKERRVLLDGGLAIHEGQILEVGNSKALQARYPNPKETIDASGKLALPGLINTHTHIAMALFRGLYAGDPSSIYAIMFPIEENLEAEDVYHLGLLGAVECLKGGATTIVDHYYFMDAIARAVEIVGLRGVLGHTIADRLAAFTGKHEKVRALRFLREWRNRTPRIIPALAPHSPETVSIETLSELRRISDKENVLLHIHLAQSPQEIEYIRQTHGVTPVELLDRIGFLGSDVLAAHCVFVGDADIDRLASHQVSVVFCPTSQVSYLHSNVTPVPELLAKGVNVALGTDTAAGTGNMNILEELRIASTVQLFRSGDQGRLSPQKLLEMVTLDAANAIQLGEHIGSLEPGKRADLLLIDLQKAELAPINDLYMTAIFGITAPNLDTILIDGQVVLSRGTVVGVDEGELIRDASMARTEGLSRAMKRHPHLSRSLMWLED
ncbi:MAG: amidohydrolase family protein [Anaerolineales bacterium]|nr:amidohydrolase family protein [Anaerolineales bacterium]